MNRARGRWLGLLVLVVTAGIWFSLHRLEWPARALTTFLLGPLPALTVLQAQLLDRLPTDAEREGVYFSSAATVWILAALAMLAARYSGLARAELGLETVPVSTLLGAAGLATLAGLAVMGVGRLLDLPENALVDYLIPRTTSEKIAFAGLSLSAGIAEELVFRSFLIPALHVASGSLAGAVALSVAAFAITHAYQGMVGVARVVVLGLILTGSIVPSMVAHAVLDLLAGLVLAEWLMASSDGDG